ncbi:MAG: SPOR domain-containing protein, partial [Gemmatimonadota bacterium]|nr:SPOR domain-containing protein [Gemmatimonadota bacterium]
RGPDQLVLRIPLGGGAARAYAYPAVDSILWSVQGAPAVDRVLGFDPDDGAVAVIDDAGQPRRIDFRATEVRLATRAKLSALASANGSDIFGITGKGDITRLNPAGDWAFVPPSPARLVFPQPNGALVIAANQGSETHLWLIRPTDDDILATRTLPVISRGIRTRIGDRIYFAVDSGLIGVLTRDLSPVKSVRLPSAPRSVVPTPSGDRLYAALGGRSEIAVIDRYTEDVSETIELAEEAEELRMDPLGQYLIAKGGGDSAWVIAIGTNRVTGAIRTEWRNDLPAFAPDGTIVTARGDNVVFVNAGDLRDTRTIRGGGRDFWYFFAWSGFRPRPADLDRPVTFDSAPAPLPDSLRLQGDSVRMPTVRDASPSMIEPPAMNEPMLRGYMVSFAAVLSEQRANEVAAGISVNGVRPRVAASPSGSSTIYRVVLGPYSTREEADRVGIESGRQYWVFEAAR